MKEVEKNHSQLFRSHIILCTVDLTVQSQEVTKLLCFKRGLTVTGIICILQKIYDDCSGIRRVGNCVFLSINAYCRTPK